MNVKELREALDGVPDDLEVWVGYEGTWNNYEVTARIGTHPSFRGAPAFDLFVVSTV